MQPMSIGSVIISRGQRCWLITMQYCAANFVLVLKLCLGTHFSEALLRAVEHPDRLLIIVRSRASAPCVLKQSLGTRVMLEACRSL